MGLVSLPCVISYFQTAHHREGKKIGRKRVIRGRLVGGCAQRGMQSEQVQKPTDTRLTYTLMHTQIRTGYICKNLHIAVV